jgi:glycosyltransferase involved in cell wall biosynthesis
LSHEKNALLVPPGDARALARAIDRLAKDAALSRALAGRAREDVRAFTWDARAAAIEDFLSGLARYHSA